MAGGEMDGEEEGERERGERGEKVAAAGWMPAQLPLASTRALAGVAAAPASYRAKTCALP